MIRKLEINGVKMDVGADLQKYVIRKIGKLDKYLPRKSRESVHVEVYLKEKKIKTRKECVCEVIMKLPQETIAVSESTMNMFAAVDIVEAKLKNQIKKYKETHTSLKLHRRVINKFNRTPR